MGLRTLLGESVTADPSRVVPLIISLSSMVIGVVFAGAVCGLMAASWARGPLAGLPRPVTATVGGVVLGVAAATCGYLVFAGAGAIPIIVAGVAGISGLIGGLLAAPPKGAVIAAGLIGTAALLVFLFLRGWFMTDLLDLLVRTPDTFRWIGIIGGVVAGMLAGLASYLYLRRRNAGTGLYGFMLGGALPGILWLLSEVATRIAGAVLLSYAGQPQLADSLYLGQAGDAQLNGSLAALFTGATTAILAFGLLDGGGAKGKNSKGGKNGKRAPSNGTAKGGAAAKTVNTKGGKGPGNKAKTKTTVGEQRKKSSPTAKTHDST
ncbi:hypothetical protein [Stackebrandtia soli]|uniref:hypothetical protein n=1 Tax=Stackebrandtia soli TaxID=1892856 RepID=UPI0039EAE5B3